MEPQGRVLMAECADKNMIDKDEYPQTAELERRCIHILGDLWNAPRRPGGLLGDRLERGLHARAAWPSSGAGSSARSHPRAGRTW